MNIDFDSSVANPKCKLILLRLFGMIIGTYENFIVDIYPCWLLKEGH